MNIVFGNSQISHIQLPNSNQLQNRTARGRFWFTL
jgi:hypothetical protein